MFMLCSDDQGLAALCEQGHMDRSIRRAKQIILDNSGLDQEQAAVLAISLATLNPAKYFSKFFRFHNHQGIGEVAVGNRANLVVLSSLSDLEVKRVIYAGKVVAENGRFVGGGVMVRIMTTQILQGSCARKRNFIHKTS